MLDKCKEPAFVSWRRAGPQRGSRRPARGCGASARSRGDDSRWDLRAAGHAHGPAQTENRGPDAAKHRRAARQPVRGHRPRRVFGRSRRRSQQVVRVHSEARSQARLHKRPRRDGQVNSIRGRRARSARRRLGVLVGGRQEPLFPLRAAARVSDRLSAHQSLRLSVGELFRCASLTRTRGDAAFWTPKRHASSCSQRAAKPVHRRPQRHRTDRGLLSSRRCSSRRILARAVVPRFTPLFLTSVPPAPPPARSDGGIFLTAHTQKAPAAFHRIKLATALRCKRFLAGSRCKLWWMSPAWRAALPASRPPRPASRPRLPPTPAPPRAPGSPRPLPRRLPPPTRRCLLAASLLPHSRHPRPAPRSPLSRAPLQGHEGRRRAPGDAVPPPRARARRAIRLHHAPHLRRAKLPPRLSFHFPARRAHFPPQAPSAPAPADAPARPRARLRRDPRPRQAGGAFPSSAPGIRPGAKLPLLPGAPPAFPTPHTTPPFPPRRAFPTPLPSRP